jgi:hypothetical protein
MGYCTPAATVAVADALFNLLARLHWLGSVLMPISAKSARFTTSRQNRTPQSNDCDGHLDVPWIDAKLAPALARPVAEGVIETLSVV